VSQHIPDISDGWNGQEICFIRWLSKSVILWFFSTERFSLWRDLKKGGGRSAMPEYTILLIY
jgi:hypothetical protein